MNNGRVTADAEAIRACLARKVGAVAEAHRWAAGFDPRTPLVPLTTFSVPHMVRARVLVAEGSPASLAAAANDLARVYDLASATHNSRYLCEVLALQAVILDAQGNQRAAMERLEHAVSIAEAGGLIRVFVDLGPKIADLLRRLPTPGGISEYRRRLLAAFAPGDGAQPAARELPPIQAVAPAPIAPPQLIEPLSRRELDVLLLLSERLTDKEIARQLFVSPQTVKRHASNIYQKLDVGNRRDAVAKAAAIGVLPAPAHERRRPAPAY